MVNSLKMKDGPHVIVLSPLGKLEGAPVDEAVVAGEGGHHLESKHLILQIITLSIKVIREYQLVHKDHFGIVHYHLEKKDYPRLSIFQLVHKDHRRLNSTLSLKILDMYLREAFKKYLADFAK